MERTITERFKASLNSLILQEFNLKYQFILKREQLVKDFLFDHCAAHAGKVYERWSQKEQTFCNYGHHNFSYG